MSADANGHNMNQWRMEHKLPPKEQPKEPQPATTSSSGFSPKLNALYALIAVQALCWLMFLFGDIGFDKAGKFGLDYDAFILIAAVYAVALVAGVVLALVKRQKRLTAVQLFPIIVFLLCLF